MFYERFAKFIAMLATLLPGVGWASPLVMGMWWSLTKGYYKIVWFLLPFKNKRNLTYSSDSQYCRRLTIGENKAFHLDVKETTLQV